MNPALYIDTMTYTHDVSYRYGSHREEGDLEGEGGARADRWRERGIEGQKDRAIASSREQGIEGGGILFIQCALVGGAL